MRAFETQCLEFSLLRFGLLRFLGKRAANRSGEWREKEREKGEIATRKRERAKGEIVKKRRERERLEERETATRECQSK